MNITARKPSNEVTPKRGYGGNWLEALNAAARRPFCAPPGGLPLGAEDGQLLLRIVSDATLITRHYELYLWLNSEIQHFLPHQILIAAWGDFTRWDVTLDVVSGMPRVRTSEVARCRSPSFVRDCYFQWVGGGRRPLMLKTSDLGPRGGQCMCAVHAALESMRLAFVHGVRDQRQGHDSVYIALTSDSFARGHPGERFMAVADTLTDQIDCAFRKVGALAPGDHGVREAPSDPTLLDLSAREREILQWLGQGKTNVDIAALLDISPFTVKNHMQRIFRKFGVSNRTHAAAKYNDALRSPRGLD
jgi:transcriptional regulator EpsA